MTTRKSDIERPDKRIAVTAQTLSFLFDVSVSQIEKAVADGTIKAHEAFGVKRFHVATIERAFFGKTESAVASSEEADPFLEALRGGDASSEKHRRPAPER